MHKCNNSNSRTDCETQIYNTFTQINNNYTAYQNAYNRCYSSATNICDTSGITILVNSITDIKNDIQYLDKYVNEYKTHFLDNDKLIGKTTNTPAGTSEFYNDIILQFNEIVQKRQKMDTQLYELYTNDSDSMYNINPTVDSTILTGIIWTILATSLIYYVVVKT